jgi:hypothetical protein
MARKSAIDNYKLSKNLDVELNDNNILRKKPKI